MTKRTHIGAGRLNPPVDEHMNDEWRRLYEASAGSANWLEVHRWDYDERVAAAVAEDIREKLLLHPRDRVLEVGCASGRMLSLVLYRGQSGYGLDMCEALTRRKADFVEDRDRVHLGVAEAARLPVRSNSFDKVFCHSVFQCFPSANYAERAMGEMLRVCKAGGVVVLGDVLGEMEKQRGLLLGLQIPERIADMLLRPLAPIWRVRHGLRKSYDGVVRRVYPRSFFRRSIGCPHCEMQFLSQQIPGRRFSRMRYDVRIRKCSADEVSAGMHGKT